MLATFSFQVLVALLLSVGASPAQSDQAAALPGNYAVIAYSQSTGKLGHFVGHAVSLEAAQKDAVAKCGVQDAKPRVWGKDQWIAFAVADGVVGTAGWGVGKSAEEAQKKAIESCRKRTDVAIRVALCIHPTGQTASVLRTANKVITTTPTSPTPTIRAGFYGAIAFSRLTGKYGFCAGHALTQKEAEENALQTCDAADAKILVASRDQWLALACGDDKTVGAWCKANSESEAQQLALLAAEKKTSGTYVAVCFHTGINEKTVKKGSKQPAKEPTSKQPPAAESPAPGPAESSPAPAQDSPAAEQGPTS